MREKKAAKMAMESKIPAKPSSMAPYFLNLPVEDTLENESEESNTNGDLGDDEAGVDVNESSEGEGNGVEEQDKFNDSVVPGSAKIELLKERTCIVCDKVGPLLVCSSHQCPSSYHQKCLPASPSSDDLGKFYCPHCSYQRANAESNLAFEKYRQAKYALFQFLNGMDGERNKQEAQEVVTKEPFPSSHATAEDGAIRNIKLEKGVYEFESKKNGQEKDIINEHGRNIRHNTEAHENALNEPVESQNLDDHEFAEMAGYQEESELNKVLTKRNCESAEISGEHGREEDASFNPVESEFTESSADLLRMVKKADIESDSDVSSSDNVPLTMLFKKLVAQGTEMIKMGRLSNFKGNNTSSSDQKSSMEDGRKEEASFNPVESEFTESSADSSKMAKKADFESDSDISNSDHEPLTKRQKKLVAQQTEMIKKGQLSNVKANKASLSNQKSSMEDGRKEEASFNPVESEFTESSADSLRMAKKADIESDCDISCSDHEPLKKRQKEFVAQGAEMIKMGRLSNFKGNNLSSPNQKSSMEDDRKKKASLHPVESLTDSVGMAMKADIESDISNSDHEPLTKRQKKLVAQRTEMIKKGQLSNVKANKASLSNQKSSMEENAGEKPKSSETRIGVLRCLRASGGHEREEKSPSDSAQSAHMLDSMEMPKKTGTDSDISDSDREIQELEKTNKSQLFNYFTYQMALEKEKVKGSKIEKVRSKSKQVQSFWNRSKTLMLSGGRRQKLLWSAEEKEMLKEGVLKFSTTTNKNLPWQKILDFGHNVFDKTRTPTDLKDKWRNMLAEETPTEN